MLTNVCNAQRNDFDVRMLVVLWSYRTNCKKLTRQTSFKLVYGMEVMMLIVYIVPSMRVVALTRMVDHRSLEERLV